MKNIIITVILLINIFTFNVLAQPPKFKERMLEKKKEIEEAKRELITQRINLKPEQEKQFWEVYDKYTEERIAIKRQIQKIKRNGFAMADSDEELAKSIDEVFNLRQKDLDLDKNYRTILLKIINVRQLVELHRTEQEFVKKILQILRGKSNNLNRKTEEEDD